MNSRDERLSIQVLNTQLKCWQGISFGDLVKACVTLIRNHQRAYVIFTVIQGFTQILCVIELGDAMFQGGQAYDKGGS